MHRPDPGLARGVWEASSATLYLAMIAVVLGAAMYLAVRLGLRRRRLRRDARPEDGKRPSVRP